MDAPRLLHLTPHGDGGHVVELTLDRPEAMNAISTAFAEQITAATAGLAADGAVRAVVISSAHDRAFCVGADLKERNGFTDAQLMEHRLVTRKAYRGVLDLPVPVLAAVEGYALGGGMEIALSCDLIVAGQEATLALPEVGVGVIPGGGGTQLLTRRVGWSRAASVIFTARRMTGAQAHDLGGEQPGRRAQRQAGDAPGDGHRPGRRPGDRGRGLAGDRVQRGPQGGRGRVRREADAGVAGPMSENAYWTVGFTTGLTTARRKGTW